MKLLSTSFKIIILSWFLLNLGVWAHSPNDNPESNLELYPSVKTKISPA